MANSCSRWLAFTLSVTACFISAQAARVTLETPVLGSSGNAFSYTCKVLEIADGVTVQEIKWYHNQTEIRADVVQHRIRISRERNSSMLSVSNALREDGGEYYCEVFLSSNSVNPIVSEKHTLQVIGIFSVTTDMPEYELLPGTILRVRCTIEANPSPISLRWTRLSSSAPFRVQNANDPMFGILNKTATIEDDGRWSCSAEGTFNSLSGEFTVTVLVPPSNTTILHTTSPTPPMRSEDFQLECTAEGNRAPNYTWFYNGTTDLTELSKTPDSRFSVDTPRGGLLTVKRATYGDAGRYTCIASNEVGSDSATVDVEIQGPPEILTAESTPQMRVAIDSGVYIDCPFISNPPHVTTQWKTGSVLLPTEETGEYRIFANNTLHFRRLDSTGETTFTCIVSNDIGSESRTFSVLVQSIPAPPTGFNLEVDSANDQTVNLTWTQSVQTGPVNEVEDYVLEKSINGEEFQLTESVFERNATSGVMSNLPLGVTYVFRLRARNIAGLSQPSNNVTYTTPPSPVPSRPSKPIVTSTATNSIKISFSVEFGGEPITHFIINVTGTKSGASLQKRFSIGEKKYVESLTDHLNSEGTVVGYDVVVVVTDLKGGDVYQFEVAAESPAGVGEFSNRSDAAKIEFSTQAEDNHILYIIIGGVFGGVFLVVLAIAVPALFCYGKQSYNQKKKTLTINSNGSHAFNSDPEAVDSAFSKGATPSVRQLSRETLTSTTNSYFCNGFVRQSSVSKPEPYDREKAMCSPAYDRLGDSPMPSGMMSPIGLKTDSVVDVPADDKRVIQTSFGGGKLTNNPQYNYHILPPQYSQTPPQYSHRPQHMQLQLQTSFNDLQRHTDSPSPPDRFGRATPTSEMQFPSNSHLLSVPGTYLSRSNPTMNIRKSCESMFVPPGPRSQATDV